MTAGSSPGTSEIAKVRTRGRRGGGGEAAALDRREVLAHRVDLADRRAAAQECARHRLLVGQGEPRRRQREERRSAARDEARPAGPAAPSPEARSRISCAAVSPGRIGDRVRASTILIRSQATAWPWRVTTMPSIGPGQAALEGPRHCRRRLAGADDEGAAGDRLWQMRGDRPAVGRIGGGESRVKQRTQAVVGVALGSRAFTPAFHPVNSHYPIGPCHLRCHFISTVPKRPAPDPGPLRRARHIVPHRIDRSRREGEQG